ncbi:MAG: helix-turn-helix domain-containing protein [Clostridia bacterium]|nr:helix-turn-helix domain-containing protein [Clostridia bacterium]
MFFESADINFRILTVLDIDRSDSKGYSGFRPFHALSYRVTGNAVFTHEKDTTNVVGGDFIFVPKNYPYYIEAGDEHLFVVHFDTDAKLPKHFKKLTTSNPEKYTRELSRLYSAWTLKRPGYQHECKYLLHKIFMNIEREAAEILNRDDQLNDAVEYIHEHFCERELTVDFLAKMCSMSDTYFRKLFKLRFKVTPLKYINDLKVKFATELLRSGYYTVTETAEKCGFENVYYFSLFIKKETGLSPSQI